MSIKHILIAGLMSLSVTNGTPSCSNTDMNAPKIENLEPQSVKHNQAVKHNKKKTQTQVYICLNEDPNTYTHTNALEKVVNPNNTILEFPIAQLYQKYGNRNHPLAVSGVGKNFRALLGKGGIENLKIKQKLKSRNEPITSETAYELGDTLRFPLINPLLKTDFPKRLSDQLKEPGFTSFFDPDSSRMGKYDIVVKKAPSGKAALAVYKNGELFMATYVSVGLKSRKTQMGQFEILSKEPYKRSYKYDNAAMPEALNFFQGFYLHQGNVTGRPASHGCIRLPGAYASVLYSLVKDKKHTDVFISTNLYN